MPYLMIENFSAGLESRKSGLTSPAGTLLRLNNAVITPGGEIAKRRAFVKVADIPAGTFGLAATESTLFTFTRNTAGFGMSSGVPGIGLTGIQIPSASPTLKQCDYDVFDGRVYLVCQDSAAPGGVWNPHYYYKPASVGPPAVAEGYYQTEGTNHGISVKTYASKMYSVLQKNLYYSAVDDVHNWTTGTGAGFTNLALQDADSENLISLEIYYEKLAIFASTATQIWTVDPDPTQNVYEQLLRGAGTNAPLSPLQYGSGDILFLTSSGVRSLKARDSSNSASVSDIGSPIDELMHDIHVNLGDYYYSTATSLLEPVVGRYWMAFLNQIYVLSYFPGPKITAWSRFTLPFNIDYICNCKDRVFIRSGDNLYAYGGVTGNDFDNCGVEVRLPYLDMKKPGHRKMFEALDATVTGTWEVRNSFDFANPDAEEVIATLTGPTWATGRLEFVGYGSHFSLRFYNNDANAATIANIAVHYKMAADED